ncbi:MAG: acetyl-CoA carboxylase biotin carboxyl carrier protein [Pyrinomonadaceae bacterium]
MSEEKKIEASGSDQTGAAQVRQQPVSTRPGGDSSEASGSNSGGGGGGGGRSGPRRRHRGEREHQPATRRPEFSINMEELRELADLITAQGFTEFELEKEGFRLRLSRNTYSQVQTAPTATAASGPAAVLFPAPQSATSPSGTDTSAATAAAAAAPEMKAASQAGAVDELYKITSPIVGTFYRAPSPASDVFVKQGSRVEADTVVCIIEAMKLMNEIQAEVGGTIEKIYVENGQPVEYGQPLFGVKK